MDVRWIKLKTSMFDDEKIKLIESMPDKDSILIIWIKLLVQAGKCNATGYIYLNETLPYTDEMLSTIFNRPLNTIRLALNIFQKFGMIELNEDGAIYINNWEKHQNIEGLEKIREQTRLRVAKHREQKKIGYNVTEKVTLRNATEKNRKEKNIYSAEALPNNIPYKEIIDYLNQKANTHFKHDTNTTKRFIKARWNEGFDLSAFKYVIDVKCAQWLTDPHMLSYLRPMTLFGTRFESYLNEPMVT